MGEQSLCCVLPSIQMQLKAERATDIPRMSLTKKQKVHLKKKKKRSLLSVYIGIYDYWN